MATNKQQQAKTMDHEKLQGKEEETTANEKNIMMCNVSHEVQIMLKKLTFNFKFANQIEYNFFPPSYQHLFPCSLCCG